MQKVKPIPKHLLLAILFATWLIAGFFIAWRAQYIDGYLFARGVLQSEYIYPTKGVILCISLYTIVMINYIGLFFSKLSKNHPLISYLLFSVVPVIFLFCASLYALHASNDLAAFIVIMLFTVLLHCLLFPVYAFKALSKYNKKRKQRI